MSFFGYSRHSGVIITASVILMNSSFLSIVSKTPRTVSATTAGSLLLDPIRELHDGGFQGELTFVELGQQGRE